MSAIEAAIISGLHARYMCWNLPWPFVLLTRGLRTALVEREDFASGTSSKSTKLVHGGVRYLEKAVFNLDYGQLKLVFEALHERKRMLENAPHLCSSLPIMTVRTSSSSHGS